jgi:hypothetical protein
MGSIGLTVSKLRLEQSSKEETVNSVFPKLVAKLPCLLPKLLASFNHLERQQIDAPVGSSSVLGFGSTRVEIRRSKAVIYRGFALAHRGRRLLLLLSRTSVQITASIENF